MRLGVVDIGSNTSTLAVYDARPDGGLDRVLQVGEALKLIRKLTPDRRFPEPVIARTVEAMARFVALSRQHGATRLVAVATSAVRDAVNQDELLSRIRRDAGLPVRVMDGETEGVAAVRAVTHMLPFTDGFVVDQGGGSLQIAHVHTRRARQVVSLPLGALRLTDTYLRGEPPSAATITALRRHVQALLGEVGWFRASAGGHLVGVGGSVRALAKVDRRQRAWPIRAGHGYALSLDSVEGLWELLSRSSEEERKLVPGLAAHRVETAAASALVWFVLLRESGFETLRVSSYGVREGVALEEIGVPEPARAPDVGLAGLSVRFPAEDEARARRWAHALHERVEATADARWGAAMSIVGWVDAVGLRPAVAAERLREAPIAGFFQEDVLAALDLLEGGPTRTLPELTRIRLRGLADALRV